MMKEGTVTGKKLLLALFLAGHSFERGKMDGEAAADGWERTVRFLNATLKKKQ